ncbi:hypothetical protein N7456_007611 [Penicillium angulare]|uniref:Heterokaryon incompatibility domain-containing protein n=1 Tax=Penicillium angulare TaxID=116970 RepID=A0A9W9FB07_9EURO|nr:hypothetical protein N7456_007611 [Penicillium angulare]
MPLFTRRLRDSITANPLPKEAITPDYKPLLAGQIRTLELLPGLAGEIIKCCLKPIFLYEQPVYDALSYCWGDHTLSKVIESDGKVVNITESLFSALSHLRDETRTKVLWVDALCINQSDNHEKTVQVAGMREIYAKASGVRIWLGPASHDSDVAMAYVNECAKIWARDGRPHGTTSAEGVVNPFQHSKAFAKGPVRALLELVRRPWFSRVWVIQECALAANRATVHAGSEQTLWLDFADVCAWAVESGIAMYAPSRVEKPIMLKCAGEEVTKTTRPSFPEEDLLPLLQRFRQFDATDARDKVYGLCGLADASAGESPYIMVNYKLSTNEVYRNFALTDLRRGKDLKILSVPRVTNDPSHLPSWVPRWDTSDLASSFLISKPEKSHNWKASKDSIPHIDLSRLPNRLGLKAMVVDTVEKVGNPWQRQDVPELSQTPKVLMEVSQIVRYQVKTTFEWSDLAQIESQEPYELTGESKRDAFWQVFINGCSSDEEREIMKEKFETANAIYRRHRVVHDLKLDRHVGTFLLGGAVMVTAYNFAVKVGLESAESLTPKDFDFQNAVNEAATQKSMFRTKNGILGLGSKLAKPGDTVVLAQGVRAPLVLRKDGNDFQLIGDAYVHGLMNGGKFSQEKCTDIWLV